MKTVFVLTGDYWHSAASVKPMIDCLFAADEWRTVFTERPEDLYEMEQRPALIVSFKDPIENDQIPTPVWCDDRWNKTLCELVENEGTGLILGHAAVTDLEEGHVMVQRMIQALFVNHPAQCPMELIRTCEHPVMADAGDFVFPDLDEQYQMTFIPGADVQVLAETKTEHGRQPAVWVRKAGKGRICCLTPAHTTGNLTCAGFMKIMKNAVHWCIG